MRTLRRGSGPGQEVSRSLLVSPLAHDTSSLSLCGRVCGGLSVAQLCVHICLRWGASLTSFSLTLGEEAAGGDRLIHERDLAWLQQADVVVAEVTQPSLGVGYELGRAVALNKQILCLFRPQSGRVLSAMIRGAADGSRFQVWDYEEGEVEAILDRYFEADPPEQVAVSDDPTA
uniref:2'-deoxynucleoside 5'-phosphate N-hydrolase 1 n=1 Tax=Spermophilus dauricus TaxID=99837 RepID=A0A8C9Q311_SPEDA